MSFNSAIRAPKAVVRLSAAAGAATPLAARALVLVVVLLSLAGGLLATDSAATARAIADAGGEWANLLRAMAGLKLLFAVAATVAVWWRLGVPVGSGKLGLYMAALAAAWAGPGLIWGLAHIGLGALLLHGGLIVTTALVWRDPATRARLAHLVVIRRQYRK